MTTAARGLVLVLLFAPGRPAEPVTAVTVPGLESLATAHTVDVGGVRLHAVEAGPGGGGTPLVVLLHGFPDFWYSWRRQIPALAAAGYRVVAPDLRGYNRSDKPAGVAAYRGAVLAADVAGLIAACGEERASVVGHDWGGAIAWTVAMRHPERVRRLAIVNAPHPARFRQGLRDPLQLVRSAYIGFFQLPVLPELALRARGYAAIRRALRRGSRRDSFPPAELERWVEAAAQPGALTAALHYYRAMGRSLARRGGNRMAVVHAPTLVLWGERDPYLRRELADPPPRLAPRARVERLPEAGHWPHVDDPERVNALLLDFLGGDT